jgi:hypothetical protein
MTLNPGELIPMAETLDFYEEIMDMFEALGLKAIDPLVEEERHDDTMGKVEVYMHGRLVEMTGSASSPPHVTAFTCPLVDASARIERFFGQNRSSTPAGISHACCARKTVERGFAAEVDAAAATTRQR